jgi:hypothetical protein
VRWLSAASISSSAALLAVAGVSSGCGGTSNAASTPLSSCERAAETAAAAHVAQEAYNAGSLGTEKQLAVWFKGVPRSRYLDAKGRLRPLSAVGGSARWDYEAWLGHLEGRSVEGIGAKMYAARLAVRHDGAASCD